MNAQQLPITLLATVVKPAKFREVKDRSYRVVGFSVQIDQAAYYRGESSIDEDFRAGRRKWVYIEGTKEVADIIAALEGLRLNERIYLRVVEFGAFGGNTVDDEGKQRDPMLKFTVDHIELPGREFKNQPVKQMAAKAKAKDAAHAAEAEVLAGTTK